MLFIAGYGPLQVIGISDMSSDTACDKHVRAIKILQCCLGGVPSGDQLSDSHYAVLSQLLQHKLSSAASDEAAAPVISPYALRLFEHVLDSFTGIWIDIGLLRKDFVYEYGAMGPQFGFCKLSPLFVDASREWINLRTIRRLTPQIDGIVIQCVERTSRGGKYAPSTMITDDIVSDIRDILSEWRLEWIDIHFPRNQPSTLAALVEKYKAAFADIGYNVEMAEYENIYFGNCDQVSLLEK